MDGDRYQVDTVGGGGGFRGTWGAGRGLWTKMVASLAAAGLSGGNCLLQVSLVASFGRCRSLWLQLAAAGLSGGDCLLQGRCEAVILAPLLMVLLL